MYTIKSHVRDLKDVVSFFEFLLYECKLSFHPDDDFEQYGFSKEDSDIYNRLMNESFSVCEQAGIDIYTVGLSSMRRVLVPETKDPVEVNLLARIAGKQELYRIVSVESHSCKLESIDSLGLTKVIPISEITLV